MDQRQYWMWCRVYRENKYMISKIDMRIGYERYGRGKN